MHSCKPTQKINNKLVKSKRVEKENNSKPVKNNEKDKTDQLSSIGPRKEVAQISNKFNAKHGQNGCWALCKKF